MCSALGFLPYLTQYFSSACLDPSLSLNTSIFPYEKNGNRGIKDDVSEGKRNIFFLDASRQLYVVNAEPLWKRSLRWNFKLFSIRRVKSSNIDFPLLPSRYMSKNFIFDCFSLKIRIPTSENGNGNKHFTASKAHFQAKCPRPIQRGNFKGIVSQDKTLKRWFDTKNAYRKPPVIL